MTTALVNSPVYTEVREGHDELKELDLF